MAKKAFEISRQLNDSNLIAKANLVIGKIHWVQEEYDEALICFEKSALQFEKTRDSLELKQNYLFMAKSFFAQKEWEKAIAVLKKANKLASNNTSNYYIEANDLIAQLYFKLNQNDSGKFYYDRITPVLIQKKQFKDLGNLYNNYGVYYYRKLDYQSALESYYKALEYNTLSENDFGIAVCYNNLGIIHRKIGNYQEALESFEHALQIKIKRNDARGMAISYNSIGIVYKMQKNFPLALHSFNTCLAHCTPGSDNDLIAAVHNNKGSIYNETNQPDSALIAFQKALKIYVKEPQPGYLSTTYQNLAQFYYQNKDLDSALYFAKKAHSYSSTFDLPEQHQEVLEICYKIYKANNQMEKALHYFEQFVALKDSIEALSKNQAIEEQSLKLFSQQKIKENVALNQENEQQQKELSKGHRLIMQQRRYIIISISTVSFLTIVLVGFIILLFENIKKNKIQLKQNLEISNQKEKIEEQRNHLETINSELERLSMIAEKTDNAVTIMDKDGNFIWFNQGFTRMYGFTPNEFVENVSANIFSASADKMVIGKIESCRQQKKPVSYSFLASCKDNRRIYIQTTLTPLIDETGEIYQYIAIDTDINEIKKAELKIRNQHNEITRQSKSLESINQELKKLSVIAEKTSNAVTLIDPKGIIEWANNSFEQIYGFTLSEIKGKEYKTIINNYFELDIKKLANVWFGTKEPISFESLNKNKNGDNIWVNTSLTPILNDQGQITKMVAIDTDITLLKQTEQELSKINSDLTSSISYAKQIQMAFMPKTDELKQHFREALIIYRPKDIVSGDFYWFTHYLGKTIVVAADCTGHGVPGAFMSLIGITSLNKIIKEESIFEPSLILEQLRFHIIKALSQKGEIGERSDGMDISVAVINHTASLLEFAGAMSQGLLMRNNKMEPLKGDRISIGFDQIDRKFNTKTYFLKPNDVIYLFTDGITDQFGKNGNEKLKSSRLKSFLLSVGNLPLQKQETELLKFLADWQGNLPQLDDMLLMGIRI